MRSVLGNEAVWLVSRELQRYCGSGTGVLLKFCQVLGVLWFPKMEEDLQVSEVQLGHGPVNLHGVNFVHLMPVARCRVLGISSCPVELRDALWRRRGVLLGHRAEFSKMHVALGEGLGFSGLCFFPLISEKPPSVKGQPVPFFAGLGFFFWYWG